MNWRCLVEDFGVSNLPQEIRGKVVEVETYTMTPACAVLVATYDSLLRHSYECSFLLLLGIAQSVSSPETSTFGAYVSSDRN